MLKRKGALLLISIGFSAPAFERIDKTSRSTLTVVLYLERSHSLLSLTAMQDELEQIMSPIGLLIQRRFHQPASGEVFFGPVVSVRFKGRCSLKAPARSPAPAALGFAYSVDGEILPFVQVNCDRVGSLLGRATRDSTVFQSESSLGRAVGRVLAHELYHVLARTDRHGILGITSRYLSVEGLTEHDLRFDSASAQAIHEGLGIDSGKIRGPRVGAKGLRSPTP